MAGLAADLDRLTDDVLRALRDGAAATPDALSFLLRRYRATGRADVRDALEPALAIALEQPFDARSTRERAAFLSAFVEASSLADDARVLAGISALAARLHAEFGAPICVDDACAIVDACLAAGEVLDPRAIVPPAIDELERIIGAAYRPGEGLAHEPHVRETPRGRLCDHVGAASALLTAYRATARIPYAMLAEELMQFAWRARWDDEPGSLAGGAPGGGDEFNVQCAAARVWWRLACLRAEDDYRTAAVIAPRTMSAVEAVRMLGAPRMESAARGLACATYGLALADWLGF